MKQEYINKRDLIQRLENSYWHNWDDLDLIVLPIVKEMPVVKMEEEENNNENEFL